MKKKSLNYILCFVLLLSVFNVAYYSFVSYKNLFHSDAATVNLLTEEIIRTKSFFPSDWIYVNDIWILTGIIYIIPFRLFFSNGFFLHGIMSFLSYLFLMYAIFLLFYKKVKISDLFLIFVFFLTGFSEYYLESLLGQAAYSWMSTMILLIFYLSFNYIERLNKTKLIIIFLLFFLQTASGIRGISNFLIPFVVSFIYMYFSEININKKKNIKNLMLTFLSGSILGLICFFLLRKNLSFISPSTVPIILENTNYLNKFMLLFDSISYFFGFYTDIKIPIISITGIYIMFRFTLFIFLLITSLFVLKKQINKKDINNKFFSIFVFSAISFYITFLLYLFTDLSINIFTSRYFFTPVIIFLVYLFHFVFVENKNKWFKYLVAIFIMFNFLLSFNDFYNLKNLNYKSSHNLLAEYLLQKNVKYGYSTYWNAGVLTVLSDFKTQINAINLVNNDIEPFYHLSFKKWYSPEFYQGDSVLILQNSEKMSFEYYNDFYFEENFLNYKIFYYDYNISENFSGNQKIKFVKNTKYYFNNKNRNLNQKELTGFSDIENWGVWTNNKYSFFKFKINNAKNEINNIRIKFNVLTDGRSFQNVIIKINKKEILNLKTKNSLVETEVRVKDTIKNENLFEIELENIFSPKEIGLNDDNRKLGIAINYIEFY